MIDILPWAVANWPTLRSAENDLSNAEAGIPAIRRKDLQRLDYFGTTADRVCTKSKSGDALFREHKYAEAESSLRSGYMDLTKEGDTSMPAAVEVRKDLNAVQTTLRRAKD